MKETSNKILLTWFEPFGSYKKNPVASIAKELHGTFVDEKEIVWMPVPSIYNTFATIKDTIIKTNPSLIINMWLASSVWWIRIETTGQNTMRSAYTDNDWVQYKQDENKKILEDWPDLISSNSNAEQLKHILTQHIWSEIEISTNADGFICNDLLYRTSLFVQQQQNTLKNVFLHIPWTDDYANQVTLSHWKIFIPREDVKTAVRKIIQHLG